MRLRCCVLSLRRAGRWAFPTSGGVEGTWFASACLTSSFTFENGVNDASVNGTCKTSYSSAFPQGDATGTKSVGCTRYFCSEVTSPALSCHLCPLTNRSGSRRVIAKISTVSSSQWLSWDQACPDTIQFDAPTESLTIFAARFQFDIEGIYWTTLTLKSLAVN